MSFKNGTQSQCGSLIIKSLEELIAFYTLLYSFFLVVLVVVFYYIKIIIYCMI